MVAAVSEATRGSEEVAPDLFRKEEQLLDKMAELAESSRFLADARVKELLTWIRTNMCLELGTAGAKWNTRVILFTDYEDTRRYLQQQLSGAIVVV